MASMRHSPTGGSPLTSTTSAGRELLHGAGAGKGPSTEPLEHRVGGRLEAGQERQLAGSDRPDRCHRGREPVVLHAATVDIRRPQRQANPMTRALRQCARSVLLPPPLRARPEGVDGVVGMHRTPAAQSESWPVMSQELALSLI